MAQKQPSRGAIFATVGVSALGYFVDIYDLLLFGIVRVPSLKELGFPPGQILDIGLHLINLQMAGMLLGGLLWGILGDKQGRLSVLFGSIFLYSIANIANAFVGEIASALSLSTLWTYGVLRFIAGVGLAGELGAAITLVSEVMSKENRGYGTTIVAAVGILGAVVGGFIGDWYHWKTAYLIGGGLGLALLVLRVSMFESGMFSDLKAKKDVSRGNFLMLFRSRDRFLKYLSSIAIGIPIWFVIGILITFSPELSKAIGVDAEISAGKSIMYCYAGLSLGDLVSGLVSQWWRSRKKVVLSFLAVTALLVLYYCFGSVQSAGQFYFLCALLGFSTGYWAVFVTIASESFGTNMRATVTTTVPNFVRGSVVPLALMLQFFHGHFSLPLSAFAVGSMALLIAFAGVWGLEETFGKDLDYIEK